MKRRTIDTAPNTGGATLVYLDQRTLARPEREINTQNQLVAVNGRALQSLPSGALLEQLREQI
jgi:predicted house-cleaning NTP pyrophosphatase (Maf/HAM1 superfamily)